MASKSTSFSQLEINMFAINFRPSDELLEKSSCMNKRICHNPMLGTYRVYILYDKLKKKRVENVVDNRLHICRNCPVSDFTQKYHGTFKYCQM